MSDLEHFFLTIQIEEDKKKTTIADDAVFFFFSEGVLSLQAHPSNTSYTDTHAQMRR